MSFKEIDPIIKQSYDSKEDDVANDFFIPVLSQGILYQRAVGYFSSAVLINLSKGLGAFVKNGGKVRLLVSPRLSQQDYEAIKKGYEIKKYVNDKLVENFDFNVSVFQRDDRFKMLAYMIANDILEIKIVALDEKNDRALFHKKIGIIKDEESNKIAFTGSGNDSINALEYNDDDYDIYCSWHNSSDELRVEEKEQTFNRIWNGVAKGLITIPFPDVIKYKLLTFKPKDNEHVDFEDIDKKYKEYVLLKKARPKEPEILEDIMPNGLYPYQNKAIEKWKENNYRGIFDMATGTGKTFTAGGAICKLFNEKKRLVVFICCPFKHLVDQWCDEMKNFNIDAIKCYGGLNYETSLVRGLTKFKQKRSNFLCVVICNGSFIKKNIQDLIQINLKDTLIVVDEAHNFGADGLSKTLNIDYPYRLALSATLDRYGDEEGTQKLYDFFDKKVFTYTLEEAIVQNKLTRYNYYPTVISLNGNEYDEYVDLSKQLARCKGKNGQLSEYGKKIAIKRARLIAGASNKIITLKELLQSRVKDKNMLIYCGAVKYGQDDYEKCEDEKKQIEKIVAMLNTELHIYASKFTAEESTAQRQALLKSFKNEDLQALVAIKCLDEGMNVPAIKTAFILASSTNPKEYIQRRGRVLRLSEGKEYAEIYDFITVPTALNKTKISNNSNLAIERNLVRKELTRLTDFARLSKNPSSCNNIIKKIRDAYKMDIILEEESDYE